MFVVPASAIGFLHHDSFDLIGWVKLNRWGVMIQVFQPIAPGILPVLAENDLSTIIDDGVGTIVQRHAGIDDDNVAVFKLRGHAVADDPQGEGFGEL